jgi:excisionase family DNA binding protein
MTTSPAYPAFATIAEASRLIGLQRTSIYKLAGAGSLRLVRAGGRSLVDIEHALAWLRSQPDAEISAPRKRVDVA